MYVQNKKEAKKINFLASAKFQSFTMQAERSYEAGEVFPENDGTAVGIVINDVKVEEDPQPIGVIVEAWVLESRLPDITAEAKEAMKNIKFRPGLLEDEAEAPEEGGTP